MKKLSLKERQFDYSFNEGDVVVFADDSPYEIYVFCEPWYVKTKKYKGKIGVVKECCGHLHLQNKGVIFLCEVQFKREKTKTMAAYFLPYYGRVLLVEKMNNKEICL